MKKERVKKWIKKIVAARYFAISTVVHVLLVLLLFGLVVNEGIKRRQQFISESLVQGDSQPDVAGPMVAPPSVSDPDDISPQTPPSQSHTLPNTEILREAERGMLVNPLPPSLMPHSTTPSVIPETQAAINSPRGKGEKISSERLTKIGDFFEHLKPRSGETRKLGLPGKPIEFPIYVAKTESQGSGAFVRVDKEGKVYAGSIPNLAEMIRFLSRGRIVPRIQGEIISLASDEIFQKKPPFIFLTGRGDFKLTDEEINNLREYIQMGGCIWGDAALPGHGSLFDRAFRREMLRVVGEGAKFTALPNNHPIYRGDFAQLSGPPPGINHKKNPVEVLNVDGFEAVIYTTNGYGAMWQVMLQEGDFKNIDRTVMNPTEADFWNRRATIFRNVEEGTLLASYNLGINTTAYLLTRFDEALRFAR